VTKLEALSDVADSGAVHIKGELAEQFAGSSADAVVG
jgi:hypothetical protein